MSSLSGRLWREKRALASEAPSALLMFMAAVMLLTVPLLFGHDHPLNGPLSRSGINCHACLWESNPTFTPCHLFISIFPLLPLFYLIFFGTERRTFLLWESHKGRSPPA